jgi:hypothetical protein
VSATDKRPFEGEVPGAVREAVEEKAQDGRIACPTLRKLAEDMDVPYRVAGAAADQLGIKVRDCDLGCF